MFFHQPVLLQEVIELMALKDGEVYYCDCTAGGGGHLTEMLRRTKHTRFIAIDQDPDAVAYLKKRIMPYQHRCFVFECNFIDLGLILKRLNIAQVNGILYDLGVSYHQLTTAGRGFSFEREGKLLMQMSPSIPALSEKLKSASLREIRRVLKEFGDVPNYRKLGSVLYTHKKLLKTTFDLRRIVEQNTPARFVKKNLHRVFQALRIWVNDELQNLSIALSSALPYLSSGGRIAVISYHSGEDRIVKNIFRQLEKKEWVRRINKKVIRPGVEEINDNPRARSAKLRVVEKCVSS